MKLLVTMLRIALVAISLLSITPAVADILGTYLHDGKFKLAGVYTFDQPIFTNAPGRSAGMSRNHGSESSTSVPINRP